MSDSYREIEIQKDLSIRIWGQRAKILQNLAYLAKEYIDKEREDARQRGLNPREMPFLCGGRTQAEVYLIEDLARVIGDA